MTIVARRTTLRALLTILLIDVAGLAAQEPYGELNGLCADSSGIVLPGLKVTATNKTTNKVYTTSTDAGGRYAIRGLDPGRYRVIFTSSSLASVEYPDVIVLAGGVVALNVSMKPGGNAEMIFVTGEAALIDWTAIFVRHSVTQEEFERLPKSRTFQSIANFSPSVTVGDVVDGGIQINGASGSENLFSIDGLSTNSLIEGHSRQDAAFEILEEVQVKTTGMEAQYGGALGGVLSAITRSGGNGFHGDIHYYVSSNALSASPASRLNMNPVDLKTLQYMHDSKFPQSRHEAGYSLGGYFIKNRLYFFSAASPQWVTEERRYLATDLSPITLYRDTRLWQTFNKLDAHLPGNLRLTAGFLWTPSSARGVFLTPNGVADQVTSSVSSIQANQNRGYFNPQSNFSLNIGWTPSSSTLVSVKAGRFWDNYKALGVLGQSSIEWGEPSADITGLPSSLQQPKGYTTIPRVQATVFDIAARNILQGDASVFLKFFGSHDFKIGLGRQKNVNKVDNSYPGGGYVTLNWNSSLKLPSGSTDRGIYGYYQFDEIGTKGSTGGTIDHLYLQDRWSLGWRLNLDVGVRLEREVIPSFQRAIRPFAFDFGWGQKVAPRVGASYDLGGRGKIKLYGSWGRFFSWVNSELSRGTFGGDVWRTYYRPLDSLNPENILKLGNGNLPGRNLWPLKFQDWRIPAFGKDQFDPEIEPMSSWIANGGVEWQAGLGLVFAARYTHTSLRDTIEDIGTLEEGSEIYIYANPGRGLAQVASPSTATPSFPLPTPKRTYDALELSFTRRFADRWLAGGSYVYSRLWGNYAGLQNSDEIYPGATGIGFDTTQQIAPTTYRPGSSAHRAWDLDFYSWDAHGNLDVTGRLATDRPHVLKLYGSYTLPFSLPSEYGITQIGGFFRLQSGTPMSTYVQDVQYIPVFVNGRGDMGRTPIFSNTDLHISHSIRINEHKALRLEFNLQNIFNQKISQYTYAFYNRFHTRSSGMDLKRIDLRKGYDYKALVASSPDAAKVTGALDPRFGQADNFSAGFSGRIGVKFVF